MKKNLLFMGLCLGFVFSGSVYSKQTEQEISAGCTTDETGGDGVRHSCWTDKQTFVAPESFYFAEKLTTGGKGSSAGSTKKCMLKYHDYYEPIKGSGIMVPTRVTLQAHAVGPKGHWAGRGWVNCKYKLFLSTLPKTQL